MTIDIRDLSARCEEALRIVASGQEIILTDGPVPRARIVPCQSPGPRFEGLHPRAIQPAPDFDAPMPDEFWIGPS